MQPAADWSKHLKQYFSAAPQYGNQSLKKPKIRPHKVHNLLTGFSSNLKSSFSVVGGENGDKNYQDVRFKPISGGGEVQGYPSDF